MPVSKRILTAAAQFPALLLFSAYLNLIKKQLPSDPHQDQGSLTPANPGPEQVVGSRAQHLPAGERGNYVAGLSRGGRETGGTGTPLKVRNS